VIGIDSRRVLSEPVPDTWRSGGMNDPREIMCDTCGDCAATYTGCVDPLDGRPATCESCGTVGKISVGDDDGSVWVELRGSK
jgi:hypothetical protein